MRLSLKYYKELTYDEADPYYWKLDNNVPFIYYEELHSWKQTRTTCRLISYLNNKSPKHYKFIEITETEAFLEIL